MQAQVPQAHSHQTTSASRQAPLEMRSQSLYRMARGGLVQGYTRSALHSPACITRPISPYVPDFKTGTAGHRWGSFPGSFSPIPDCAESKQRCGLWSLAHNCPCLKLLVGPANQALTSVVSSGCFPGHVTVQVRDGYTFEKLMQDVSIGDEVMFDWLASLPGTIMLLASRESWAHR